MTTKSPDVCLVWQTLSYSGKSDSPQTVDEVRKNNARRTAYCGSKK